MYTCMDTARLQARDFDKLGKPSTSLMSSELIYSRREVLTKKNVDMILSLAAGLKVVGKKGTYLYLPQRRCQPSLIVTSCR